jgi:DNA invertase Pin-like site-specific DNA recombinase
MTVALIYVRQSRTDEASVSLDVQEAACRRIPEVVAASADQVEVFRDEDVSGGTERRVRYQDMLRRIADARSSADVAVVVAFDLSRVSRDAEMLLRFHRLMTAKPWIAVRFADGMPFGSTAMERAMFGNSAVFAEWHKNVTSEKVRDGYQHRNARGAATGMPPYGYRRKPRPPKTPVEFEVVEDQAAIVRRLYEDYAAGQASTRTLAERLNAQGITKPDSRSGGLGWVPDTLVDLLQNVAYIGKTYSVSRARREGQLIDADWEPIVERDVFDRVQLVLAKNRVGPGVSRGATHTYAFAGLLECGSCGRPLRALTAHSSSYYYHRRDVGADHQCASAHRSVREGRLLPWAGLLFDRVDALRPADFDKAVAAASRHTVSPDAIEQVERSLERQRKLFTWGHISEDDYLREAKRLEELGTQLRGALPAKRAIQTKGIRDLWHHGGADARRQLLSALFDRLIVRDGEIVEYVPRVDRAAEVIALVEQAIGPSGTIEAPQTEYG